MNATGDTTPVALERRGFYQDRIAAYRDILGRFINRLHRPCCA
jgi:hypothetical protein